MAIWLSPYLTAADLMRVRLNVKRLQRFRLRRAVGIWYKILYACKLSPGPLILGRGDVRLTKDERGSCLAPIRRSHLAPLCDLLYMASAFGLRRDA